MKMKTVSSLFCAVAFLGTASIAMAGAYGEPEQAEELPRSVEVAEEVVEFDEFQPFAYGAAAALYAEEFFDGKAKPKNNSYGWGLNLRAGYRFHPNVAIEALYEQVIQFDADQATDRDTWSLMPNAKIFIVEGFCEPYVSIGAGLMKANAQRTPNIDDGFGFAGRFGLGADFYATENIFIETEVAYTVPTNGASNYQYLGVSLGIGYAFN